MTAVTVINDDQRQAEWPLRLCQLGEVDRGLVVAPPGGPGLPIVGPLPVAGPTGGELRGIVAGDVVQRLFGLRSQGRRGFGQQGHERGDGFFFLAPDEALGGPKANRRGRVGKQRQDLGPVGGTALLAQDQGGSRTPRRHGVLQGSGEHGPYAAVLPGHRAQRREQIVFQLVVVDERQIIQDGLGGTDGPTGGEESCRRARQIPARRGCQSVPDIGPPGVRPRGRRPGVRA